MRRIVMIIAVALTLGGCAGGVIPGVTTTFENPVGKNELAAVYRSYLIAKSAYVAYRDLGICPRGQVESFTRPCARRDILERVRSVDRTTYASIVAARRFVRDNPTLSAYSAVMAARTAVEEFRFILTQNNVR